MYIDIIGFNEIGGYDGLQGAYFDAIPQIRDNTTDCGIPRDDAFAVFRHASTSDNPWPGLLLQASLGCVWYWCADQVTLTLYLTLSPLL